MRKSLVVVGILVFLFVALAGLNLSMTAHEDGKMSNCPFMIGQNSMCQMPVGNHISQWQQMFTATPFSGVFFILLLGFILAVWSLLQRTYFSLAPPLKLRLYKKEHPDSKLFNSLTLAFSDGIIHPKIYS